MARPHLSLLFLFVCLIGIILFWLVFLRQPAPLIFENSVPAPEESPQQNDRAATDAPPAFVDVTEEECTQECASFVKSEEQYYYCRNVCGFSLDSEALLSAPDAHSSLSAQYQLKEEAIKEKNLGTCADIEDANLRKSCEVRITEDLLE